MGYMASRQNRSNNKYYFRDLSWAYDHRQEFGHTNLYDNGQMDRDFRSLPGVNSAPGVLWPVARTSELEVVVNAVFHFDESYE